MAGMAARSDTGSSLMLREAAEAPEVVKRLIAANAEACRELGARLRAAPPRFVVTCARGSSDSAATFAKYLIELNCGVVTASVGPSVSSIYGAKVGMGDALFLAISQSGRSPDLLALAGMARADGALTVAIVNDAASPLAEACEVVLPLHAGPERSVAATKTYLASLAAALQMVAEWSAEPALLQAAQRLPDGLIAGLTRDWRKAVAPFVAVRSLYVVGRGVGYAAAQEIALKFKETCGLHAEAISAAELMHGPLALAGPDFPVLIVGQNDAALASLKEMAAVLAERDVPVIAAGPGLNWPGMALPIVDGLHPYVQAMAAVQSFYALANAVALARGRDPDRPPHLRKVTETL
jgi:glutamine---fructose-6-phosphate transaminase (isomerizing)